MVGMRFITDTDIFVNRN